MSWPYPRLIQTKWRTLLIAEDANGDGRLLNLKWATSEYWIKEPLLNLGDLTTIKQMDIVDFGLFWLLCIITTDDVHEMYVYYPDTGWQEGSGDNVCGIGINFNGQFIGARGREVLWTAIGNYEFSPSVDRTAGFRSLFIPPAAGDSKILKLMQLGRTVVAYASNGRISLSPNVVGHTFAYGEELAYGLGVRSSNHVAGDSRIHGFIDLAGDFWTITEGDAPEKRGYREYIKSMDADSIIVSFLPADRRFYICDGLRCLVINQFGAHHINTMVSGVAYRWDGAIMASGIDTLDIEARVTTEWLDYGSRGIKSVESLLASMSSETEEVWLSVDYRMRKNQPFSSFKWVTGGPQVESAIHVAALDFRLRMRALDYHDIEIDSLLSNVKYSDQRFKRGTAPAQYEVEGQEN